jgi:hypothetical protein
VPLPLPEWLRSRLPPLPPPPPLLSTLPGARQRRRALLLLALAVIVWLLRPLPPFQWMPGWSVGGLQILALIELLRWLWWPRRWQ